MGREDDASHPHITPAAVEAYLRRSGYADAVLERLRPLGGDTETGLKSYGYGRPLRATFRSAGVQRDLVIRTMSGDPFGHDRRADRADALLLSYDTFGLIPRHIHPIDVGAFDDDGSLVTMKKGEIFLVTDFVEGELYAADLFALQKLETPGPRDLERTEALARYLAELHQHREEPSRYQRHLRDLVGSGEGIFGQTDGYPPGNGVVDAERLQQIEILALRWRWRMKAHASRCARTHGDFHPFNILFRDGADFSVLDCSRGAAGEPADDVTCLSVNYIFFALSARGRFDGALRVLWDHFWKVYLDASKDRQVLAMVAPYFAWRLLVVASPVWYPSLAPDTRERLLRFGERLLGGETFDPSKVDRLLQ